jgi:hypothetical protein
MRGAKREKCLFIYFNNHKDYNSGTLIIGLHYSNPHV